jgi:glycosyltransferase involved in cell wall biosynthesis
MTTGKKYRLLFVDTAPSAGGSVVSLYELLRNLDRSVFEPVVVTYAPHAYVERFRALGLDVIVWNVYDQRNHRLAWVKEARGSGFLRWLRRLPWGERLYHGLGFLMLLGRRVWPRARALRDVIRQEDIALVHTNIRVGHDREGILAARMAGIPCVAHIRDFEQLNWFDRWLARRVEAFIYISKAIQRCHLQAGVSRSKGHVVYNAVDNAAFAGPFDRLGMRTGLGLEADDLAVGLVARLERWKGHEVFLRAMALVKETVPQARGIVIGDAVPYDLDYGPSLVALRDELGLSGQVIFSPFQQDMPATMAALDLLVLASTSPEPFGRVLIEAMAAGKPVIATDAGAAQEIITHGVHGLLVPPGDVQALANAVVQILTQPTMAREMGQKGRTRARQEFGVRRYVDSVQGVYHELLG